jgi:DNA repair exonuclease SbcCD ATPase subunit
MKLDFVEICGFRGFRDRARFDFPAGFAVFSGRNGAGKSTVLDAVDFAITGTINKFTVTKAKGGGLDEHVWWVGSGTAEAHYVTVGFVAGDGQRFSITRSRDRGFQSSVTDVFSRLCVTGIAGSPPMDTLMQTTLIRDESIVALSVDLPEQARAAAVRAAIGGLVGPDHSQRTGELLKAANAAKQAQEQRVHAAQAELGRSLSELTEARSAAERSPDLAAAMQVIDTAGLTLPSDPRGRADAIRRYIADRRRVLQVIEAARRTVESFLPEIRYVRSAEAGRNLAAAEQAERTARDEKQRADQMLLLAERAAASERESDSYATHLTALLEHGQGLGLQDGHCPLCAASRSQPEFAAALASTRRRLAERGERLAEVAKALQDAIAAARDASHALENAELNVVVEVERKAQVDRKLSEVLDLYQAHSFSGAPDDPAAAQPLLLSEQERLTRLERALYTLEASSAADRIASLEARVASLRQRGDGEAARLVEAERAAEAANRSTTAPKRLPTSYSRSNSIRLCHC